MTAERIYKPSDWSNAIRRFAVMLVLLPFLMLTLFNNGTMLTRTADDRLTVVLCTGTEQVEMVWLPDGSLIPVDETSAQGNETPAQDHDNAPQCDWQITAQAALAPDTATPPSIPANLVSATLAIDVPLHGRRINVLAPSARGPPRTV